MWLLPLLLADFSRSARRASPRIDVANWNSIGFVGFADDELVG